MITRKSREYLTFYAKPIKSDRKMLKDALEKYRSSEWKVLDFLIHFTPVLEHMREVKHTTFTYDKGCRNREIVLEYLLFVKNKQRPSWIDYTVKMLNREFQCVGLVRYFQEKYEKKHRTTIVENTNVLFKHLIMFFRQNQLICETLMK